MLTSMPEPFPFSSLHFKYMAPGAAVLCALYRVTYSPLNEHQRPIKDFEPARQPTMHTPVEGLALEKWRPRTMTERIGAMERSEASAQVLGSTDLWVRRRSWWQCHEVWRSIRFPSIQLPGLCAYVLGGGGKISARISITRIYADLGR